MAATLKVDTIQNASSATANITLDTAGNATVGNTLAMGSSFLRNRIINGDMRIAQRGTSFSVTAGTSLYAVDRWLCASTGGTLGVAQVANPATGFQSGLQITGGASISQAFVSQRIESVNISDLAGSTVTLQVNIKASSNQTILWAAYYPNAADNYSGVTYIGSNTFNATTTATTFSAQMTLPTNAANGVWILFYPQNGGAFTSGTVTFTGVQLEVGTVATPFERRQYGQELALCYRYYQQYSGNEKMVGYGYMNTSSVVYRWGFTLGIEMRTAPTVAFNGDVRVWGGSAATTATAISTISSSASSTNFIDCDLGCAGVTTTTGLVCKIIFKSTTANLSLSAEL